MDSDVRWNSPMPRKERIDAPGARYHIICLGIEKGKIFHDETNHINFVDRLSNILAATVTRELKVVGTREAKHLGITQPAVSKVERRGEQFVKEINLTLIEEGKL